MNVKYALLLFLLAVMAACSMGDDMPDPIEEGLEVMVTVTTNTSEPLTRAVITDDAAIHIFTALIFDQNNKLLYATEGVKRSGVFTFKLLSSGTALNIYFVANVQSSLVTGFTPGTALSTVKQQLSVLSSGVTNANGYPMAGMARLNNLPASFSNNLNVIMLRSTASARIVVNASIPVSKFKLVSVAVYRANDRVQVIPAADPANWNSPKVTEASPAGAKTNGVFSVDNTSTNSIDGIMVPEASPVTEANLQVRTPTVLVVGGVYNNSGKTTYYRVDFNSELPGHPFGQVLRNYKYTLNINNVDSEGWDTPGNAADNAASGTSVTIQNWDGNASNVTIDGPYYFAIPGQDIILPFYAEATVTIPVITNIPNFTASWDSPPTTSISPGGSFTNPYYKVDLAADKKSITITTRTNNYSAAAYSSTLYIKLVGQTVTISIKQSNYGSVSGGGCDILSLGNAGLGYLGTYTHWNSTAAEPKAAGLKALLVHPNNFGATGRVPTSRLNIFTEMNPQDDHIYLQRYIGTFNIIYLNEAIYTTGPNSAQVLIDWAKSSPRHYLIYMFDRAKYSPLTPYNLEILNKLGLTDITSYYVTAGAYTQYSANYNDAAMSQIYKGPFGNVASGFSFRNIDAIHSEMNLAAAQSKGIKPILLGNEGGMLLGIDFTNRIVHCGDVDIFNALAGGIAQYINTDDATSGTANDATKLIANLWAYMIRTVSSN